MYEGIVGGVLTGFFASDQIDAKVNSVFYGDSAAGARQLGVQILVSESMYVYSMYDVAALSGASTCKLWKEVLVQ
jgi:ammonia channel protein AmtB